MSFIIDVTKNGKDCILYNNYKYRESYSLKNRDIVWRCLGRNCKACIKTNPEKTSIIFSNDTHTGQHPVTIRALTPTQLSKKPGHQSPRQNPLYCNSTPIIVTSPQAKLNEHILHCNVEDKQEQPDGGSLNFTAIMSTRDPSRITEENEALKGKISELQNQMKIILDHSIESDQRLLEFTDQVFVIKSPHPSKVGPTTDCGTQTEAFHDLGLNNQRLAEQLSIASTGIRLPEEEISLNKSACQTCSILREETKAMINSIECLEEEKKLLLSKASQVAKNVTNNENCVIPIANRFEALSLLPEKDNLNFVSVEKRKKRKNKAYKQNGRNIIQSKCGIREELRVCKEHAKTHFPHLLNITILGDSHCRGLRNLLKDSTDDRINVTGVCKPGAGLLQIATPSPPRDCQAYVIVAGTNDVDAGRQDILFRHLEEIVVDYTTTSKVILVPLPHRHDLPPDSPIHDTVNLVNNYMDELCCRYEGVRCLNISDIRRQHFTVHGMHLKDAGKRILAKLLARELAQMAQPTTRRKDDGTRLNADVSSAQPPRHDEKYAEAVMDSAAVDPSSLTDRSNPTRKAARTHCFKSQFDESYAAAVNQLPVFKSPTVQLNSSFNPLPVSTIVKTPSKTLVSGDCRTALGGSVRTEDVDPVRAGPSGLSYNTTVSHSPVSNPPPSHIRLPSTCNPNAVNSSFL